MKYIFFYFLIINAIAVMAMALDKSAARNGDARVRESSLITVAALGGSVGMLLAMYSFRHKTRKNKFKYGVPTIMFIQIVAGVLFYFVFLR